MTHLQGLLSLVDDREGDEARHDGDEDHRVVEVGEARRQVATRSLDAVGIGRAHRHAVDAARGDEVDERREQQQRLQRQPNHRSQLPGRNRWHAQ